MPTQFVAHLHFSPTHKPTLKNVKEPQNQRTTTRQITENKLNGKMGDRLTGVLQYWGRSAIFELW